MRTLLTLFTALSLLSCGSGSANPDFQNADQNYYSDSSGEYSQSVPNGYSENTYQNMNNSSPSQGMSRSNGQITLMDQGLQMPYGSITVPSDWNLSQDIALNLGSAEFARFKIDLTGPNGEFARSLGTQRYMEVIGQNAQGAWQYLLQRGMSDVTGIEWGQMELDREAMNSATFQSNLKSFQANGGSAEQYISSFKGNMNGQRVNGAVSISNIIFSRGAGLVMVNFTTTTGGDIQAARAAVRAIWGTLQFNPEHDAAIGRIMQGQTHQIDQNTATMTQQHEERMRNQKDNFNAHQEKMNGVYQSNDQQNAAWMNAQRGSGSSSSSSEYGNQERFIDQQYERTTFTDEQTGYPVHQDGQHDYWYTNGDGKYFGTDDVNFDPHSMGNDWHKATPLNPR